jgi:uncharacterized membrane protein YhaH (DUF805 family)
MDKQRHGLFKWYATVLIDNYANFSGRARRQEYWMFVLFWVLTILAINMVSITLEDFISVEWSPAAIGVFALATLIPWLALNVRRLHDIGKSGGYLFINFIPIIGRIWYIVLMATNGDNFPNKYGRDPKACTFDEINDIGKPIQEE